MKTFAEEPKFGKLLRVLKITGFCRISITAGLMRLGALLLDNLQMGVFPSIDVCFYWLA